MPTDPAAATHCAILAGGRGSRIGGNKAAARLAGRPLIDYPVAAARAAGLTPLIVAKPETPMPDAGAEIVLEPPEPSHPLLGVATALERLGSPLVVCPCDLPRLPPTLLAALAHEEGPVVVEWRGRTEPLLGLWEPGLAEPLRAGALAGRSARALADELAPRRLGGPALAAHGAPSEFLVNVNTREDLARVEGQMDPGAPG